MLLRLEIKLRFSGLRTGRLGEVALILKVGKDRNKFTLLSTVLRLYHSFRFGPA